MSEGRAETTAEGFVSIDLHQAFPAESNLHSGRMIQRLLEDGHDESEILDVAHSSLLFSSPTALTSDGKDAFKSWIAICVPFD